MPELLPKVFHIQKGPHLGDEIVLRSYRTGDEEECLRFMNSAAEESTHTLKYVGMNQMTHEQLRKLWEDYRAHAVNFNLAAFAGNRVIGQIRGFQKNPTHPWTKHIAAFGMAVSQEMWGSGIGTLLLKEMENHLRQAAIYRIEAEVRVENQRGVQLYTKNGYKIEGRREKAALINGIYVDEYYLGKILD
jgi:RimJ/RimL family protein N-acetyltransferase